MRNEQMLKIGGYGSLFWLAGVVLTLVFSFLVLSAANTYLQATDDVELAVLTAVFEYDWMQSLITATTFFGLLGVSLGALALAKKFKSQTCRLAALFGFVGAVLVVMPQLAAQAGSAEAAASLETLSVIIVALFTIVLGFGLMDLKNKLKGKAVNYAGILLLVAGILSLATFAAPLLYFVAYIVAVPALVLLALVLLKAK